MAVTKDTSGGVSGLASGTTINQSITIASNSNRALYVWLFMYDTVTAAETCSGINWNTSEAMTQLATTSTANIRGYLFRLKAPTATTANITATVSASLDGWSMHWYSAYNVDQTTSESTAQTNTGTTETKFAVSCAGYANGISIGAAIGGDTITALANSDGIPYWVASGAQSQAAAQTSRTNTTAPAGRIIGDLEYATFSTETANSHTWSGSGWTKGGQDTFGTTRSTSWGYRIYDGSNVDPAASWTGSADVWSRRHLFRDTKADGTAVAVLGTRGSGTGTTHSSTGANTTEADVLAIYSDTCNANTALGAPGGSWTERWDSGSATGPSRTAGGTQPIASSGTGSGNLSMTGGGTAWLQQQFEIYNSDAGDQALEDAENNIGAAGLGSSALGSETGDTYNTIVFDRTGGTNEWLGFAVGLNPAAAASTLAGARVNRFPAMGHR